MKTVSIQIGNTDDKLTQKQWAEYCGEIVRECDSMGEIHFSGGSPTDARWQNYCVVLNTMKAEKLKDSVQLIRSSYDQDSLAWTEGTTIFI